MAFHQQSRAHTATSSSKPDSAAAPSDSLQDPLGSSGLADGADSIQGPPVQLNANPTSTEAPSGGAGGGPSGLPDTLKAGVESLSGLSMDDVKVHYNSSKPAQLQAHAYAQGSDIHLAPGRGADLPHEAWHVAQQKGGRVGATTQRKGIGVNDSSALETEADTMGAKALQVGENGGGVAALAGTPAPSGVAQLSDREGNPHANGTSYEGWDTTAHHIVAHATIKNAFGKLDEGQKAKVLREAIPSVLTPKMLDNLGCVLKESDPTAVELQKMLAGTAAGDTVVGGQKLDTMRNAFLEWQGGNQYQGPNTSIRTEPTSNKDDLDFDGQYFNGMGKEDFQTLKDIGVNLPKMKDKGEIEDKLVAMLKLTKDLPVEEFDIDKWQEITEPAEVAKLAKNPKLNRKHLEDYAYFKFAMSDIGEAKTYDKITGGSGDYYYDGVKIKGFQDKGQSGYVKVADSKSLQRVTDKKLTDLFKELGVTYTESGSDILITPDENVVDTGKSKFKVTGFEETQIPFTLEGNKFKSNKGIINNKKMPIKFKNFYDYAIEKNIPTSTFLPKQLYAEVTAD